MNRRYRAKLHPLLAAFLLVLGVFVVTINLTVMFPNPLYDASWPKVVVAGFFAMIGLAGLLDSRSR